MELLNISHCVETETLENVISTYQLSNSELVMQREGQSIQLDRLKQQVLIVCVCVCVCVCVWSCVYVFACMSVCAHSHSLARSR